MTKEEVSKMLQDVPHDVAVSYLRELFGNAVDQAYARGREQVREEMATMLELDAEEEFSEPVDANMYELFYAMAKRIRNMDLESCPECEEEAAVAEGQGN